MRTYLAGPIFGMTDATCKDWRAEARRLLPQKWEVVDPMTRDYRGREAECQEEIVSGDLLDIRRCHLLLAHACVPSWGTAMEIYQASMWGIPVYALVTAGQQSPWLMRHTVRRETSLPGIIAAMRKAYP